MNASGDQHEDEEAKRRPRGPLLPLAEGPADDQGGEARGDGGNADEAHVRKREDGVGEEGQGEEHDERVTGKPGRRAARSLIPAHVGRRGCAATPVHVTGGCRRQFLYELHIAVRAAGEARCVLGMTVRTEPPAPLP